VQTWIALLCVCTWESLGWQRNLCVGSPLLPHSPTHKEVTPHNAVSTRSVTWRQRSSCHIMKRCTEVKGVSQHAHTLIAVRHLSLCLPLSPTQCSFSLIFSLSRSLAQSNSMFRSTLGHTLSFSYARRSRGQTHSDWLPYHHRHHYHFRLQ
jgi:hypothetical protein